MTPQVLVTCGEQEGRFVLPRPCADALARAGALPLILPSVPSPVPQAALLVAERFGRESPLALVDEVLGAVAEAALEGADGLFLSGGFDIDPRLFGEEPLPALGRLEPDRDVWEAALVRAALRLNVPLLAVCRGMQLLNVAAGGTMYQDLAAQLPGAGKHRQDAPGWWPTHLVRVERGSLLASVLGCGGPLPGEGDGETEGASGFPAAGFPLAVNSFHHQAVREPAPGLRMVAVAPDGVVEAIESPRHRFVVGVQWHPELMEGQGRLFAGFVAACLERAEGRSATGRRALDAAGPVGPGRGEE